MKSTQVSLEVIPMKKRAYRAVAVKRIELNGLGQNLAEGPVWVGLDVSKDEVYAVVRDSRGQFERPWRVRQPLELRDLVERLVALGRQRRLVIALESTGTYGDPVRQALSDAGLEVHRVSSKAASDYAEVFDGVPSQHDGKDAAVVAELAAIGKSRPWPCETASAWEDELHGEVQWLDAQQDILQVWLGRLESLLARHWPELLRLVKLRSATLLRLLIHYGGPAELRKDPQARDRLRRWGRRFLREEKITAILESAESTLGVRMTPQAAQTIRRCAKAAWQAHAQISRAKRALERLGKQNEAVQRVAPAVGLVTAGVLYASVGDPRDYSCGAAYRKALGLNLKERSSGRYKGHLKITKRGPGIARRWLYLAALRTVQRGAPRSWFLAKKQKDQGRGGKGVVAVMRKLALAVYSVAVRGEPFSVERLFRKRAERGAPRGRRRSRPGALPPDPRDLSLSGQSRKAKEGAGGERSNPPPLSVLAPGAALGSVPTGALSSARVNHP